MIETWMSTQDSNKIYDRCIHTLKVFTPLLTWFLKRNSNEHSIINILNISTSLQPPFF
jgi:hypothetical protein